MSSLLFVWPRPMAGPDVDGQENGAEGPTAFGSGEKRNHPWADWQARSSLEPSAHQAITPGPCRGWGRHRLAHIRAQREPVLHRRAPAPITADTKGLPVARAAWQATGRPFAEGGRNADQQNARGAARREATFRSRGRGRLGGTRTRIKKALRAGRPAGHAAECGTGATPPKAGTAHGERGGQEPLRPLRRGREAPRLELPDSTGSVPLQSG